MDNVYDFTHFTHINDFNDFTEFYNLPVFSPDIDNFIPPKCDYFEVENSYPLLLDYLCLFYYLTFVAKNVILMLFYQNFLIILICFLLFFIFRLIIPFM